MSVQLSGGTIIDTLFVSDGTRLQLVNQLESALVGAGWTAISGTGTSDWVYESAITPQGLKFRVEGTDPGSGNCAQFKLKSDTLTGSAFYLLPSNTNSFRIWANKYQFFFFRHGTDISLQRALVCAGVPWAPDFVVEIITPPWVGWMHGNGTSDGDTTNLAFSLRVNITSNNITKYWFIWNEATFGDTGNTAGRFGLILQHTNSATAGQIDDQWEDGTWTFSEPVIVWSGGLNVSNVSTRHGQLWDSIILTKPLDSEVKRQFANYTWRNVTQQAGLTAGRRGSLLLITNVGS